METSDLQEAVTLWRVVWRFAMMECGEQCAVTCGVEQMQQLHAGNLDIPVQVPTTS